MGLITPRYKLRTLLILLAILPPLLWFGWGKYEAWKAERERQRLLHEIPDGGTVYSGMGAYPNPPNFKPDPRPAKVAAKAGE